MFAEVGRKMEQIRHRMSIIVMYDHSLTFQPESNIFANLGKEDQKKVRQVCAQGLTLKYISRHKLVSSFSKCDGCEEFA